MSDRVTAPLRPPLVGFSRAREIMWARSRAVVGHAVILLTVLALWYGSLRGVDLSGISGLGLLDVLPVGFYVALGLLLVGLAAAASSERPCAPIVWLYLLALVAILHATTVVLYDVPRYAWTYKHLGVIELIAATGRIQRGLDIYNNWPGFFALSAWLRSVTGLAPLRFAEWAEVFFNVLGVLSVRFAVRGLTADARILAIAPAIFLLGNWVGNDYLAPQSMGLVLALVVFGLCVRCAPAPRVPRTAMGRWWDGRVQRLEIAVLGGRPAAPPSRAPVLAPAAALWVGAVCYLAVVVSHQLSPVMMIAGVGALAIAGRRVPLWIPVAMVAVEAWWVALAFPFLRGRYDLFSVHPFSRPDTTSLRATAAGGEWVAWGTRGVVVVVLVLAVAGLVRRVRGGHWDVPAVVLVLAPLAVSTAQSYSGEGTFRAYLFALPWLSFLAAAACAPGRPARWARLPWLARAGRLVVPLLALAPMMLLACFGLELVNHIQRDDVRAAIWYEDHAPRGSALLYVTPNFPERVSADYGRVRVASGSFSPNMTDQPAFRGHRLGARDIPQLERMLGDLDAPASFVVLSRSEEGYAREYGVLPPGSFASFAGALSASRDFRLVYRGRPALIFQYLPRGRVQGGRGQTALPAVAGPAGRAGAALWSGSR